MLSLKLVSLERWLPVPRKLINFTTSFFELQDVGAHFFNANPRKLCFTGIRMTRMPVFLKCKVKCWTKDMRYLCQLITVT